MYSIDKSSRIPLYLQLMDILINKINKSMKEHEQLISEREICDLYNVSRTTVRQALDTLERDGYIYKIHGKGTFISPKRLHQDLMNFYSFTEEMKKIGRVPKSEVIGFEIVNSDEKLMSIFKGEVNDLCYKITRVRKADNIAMMYEVTYLPYGEFEGLSKNRLEEKPMYEIFVQDYDVKLTSAEEYFEPILTSRLESIYLEVQEGSPSLRIERLTYDNNKLIEYTIGVARGDKFKYRVKLQNK